ncbi:MAG TPA: TetR/AcrR family transcriptional regulator [Nocardioidaceae bacterium]|nr:TetR/AcrR family transcriptional regulator [Nocardioidaceae bacterium]
MSNSGSSTGSSTGSRRPSPSEAERADVLRNRGAILDAAVDVLADDPSASLSEVARRAGLGRATLYRHFPSREALRDAIRQEALTRARTALGGAGLDDVPAREGVRRAAEVLVPLGMRFRVLLAEGADVDPDFTAARDVALAPLIGLVARAAAERGSAGGPAVNPAWTGMVLANLLVTAARAADAGVIAPDEAADLVAATLFDGIG